jgi:hypothetical protein
MRLANLSDPLGCFSLGAVPMHAGRDRIPRIAFGIRHVRMSLHPIPRGWTRTSFVSHTCFALAALKRPRGSTEAVQGYCQTLFRAT